jgi:hypothetical protein
LKLGTMQDIVGRASRPGARGESAAVCVDEGLAEGLALKVPVSASDGRKCPGGRKVSMAGCWPPKLNSP